MTDKEILEEVHRRLNGPDPHGWKTNPLKDGVTSFIEQEWQKRDECGLSESDQALYLEEARRLRGELDEELYNNLPRAD